MARLPSVLTLVMVLAALGCGSAQPSGDTTRPTTTEGTRPEDDAGTAARTQQPPATQDGPPTAMVELGAGPDGRPRSIPAVLRLRAHLPGSDANRHLAATLTIGLGAESTLTGCVDGPDFACEETQREILTAADHDAYVRAWSDVTGMPRCEPLARLPGDRLFTLEAAGRRYEDPLPADPSRIAARTTETCAAPARLAVWIARRMHALP